MKFLFKKSAKPKFLSLYTRSDGHIFLIPNSFNKDNLIVNTNFIKEIPVESTDEQFIISINDCLQKCNVQDPIDLKDISKLNPMCRVTGYSTYSRAVKGMKLVEIEWKENEGYTLTPTEKKKELSLSIEFSYKF